jgi:hypothetical protein
MHRYNWHRPHGSIGSNPPISRLPLAGNNLLRLHSVNLPSRSLGHDPLRLARRNDLRSNYPTGPKFGVYFTADRVPSHPGRSGGPQSLRNPALACCSWRQRVTGSNLSTQPKSPPLLHPALVGGHAPDS